MPFSVVSRGAEAEYGARLTSILSAGGCSREPKNLEWSQLVTRTGELVTCRDVLWRSDAALFFENWLITGFRDLKSARGCNSNEELGDER